MIEVEWKPNIQRDRILLLMPPLPSAEACSRILSQPLMSAHYRNTIQTLCKNERVPYVVVYVPGLNTECFDDLERFERLYGIEVRIIPKLEKLYTSLEYSATLTHECVYMLRDSAEWNQTSIPLEWFFDMVLQDHLYPYYDETSYWLSKELKKFMKIHPGSSVIYEKCMLSMKFMSALETLLKKALAILDKKRPTEEDDEPAEAAEADQATDSPFMEMLITPPKDMEEDADADEDPEDAEDTEDDLDSAIPHSKQEWVIVLGEMTQAEKKAIYGTLKPLLDANQVRQLICVGFHQERDTRMNCDEWFFESDGTRRYPKVQYQSLRAMELSSSFLKDLLPKLNFATSQRLVQTSLFWAGAFRVENPDKKRRWPKAFYSPDAWCSLHPNETYGAIHATTDWLLYEPAGAMHIMAKPSNS